MVVSSVESELPFISSVGKKRHGFYHFYFIVFIVVVGKEVGILCI